MSSQEATAILDRAERLANRNEDWYDRIMSARLREQVRQARRSVNNPLPELLSVEMPIGYSV